MSELVAIVLAAGKGTRMKSELSKVLHTLAGRPLIHYPIASAIEAGAGKIVVVASPENRDLIESYLHSAFGRRRITLTIQDPPRGTGDAARVGLAAVPDEAERVLILNGDVPLLRSEDLERLGEALDDHTSSSLSFLSCDLDEPAAYGRILREENGDVLEIREFRDLTTDAQRAVTEVNAGIYLAKVPALREALGQLSDNNAQGELYLTDVVALARQAGAPALGVLAQPDAMRGVNDRSELAAAERVLFARIAERHGKAGVSVRGDARIDDTVTIEPDATIEGGVCLRGKTRVGKGTTVDVGCVITDSTIGSNAMLKPYSVVVASEVHDWAQIGPFAHLRPGSVIEDKAHIGNFVETKKTVVRKGAKANHLAYLGDGDIGEGANVGAGTIFCNYDGYKKHLTVIKAGAFIGSDSQLVAPVTVGEGAYVATGTTVTKDVPDDALAIGRIKQENKLGYAARLKARLSAAAKRDSEKLQAAKPVPPTGETGRDTEVNDS